MAVLSPALFLLFLTAIHHRSAAASAAVCPGGWKLGPSRNDCFILTTTSLPWSDSEQLCQTHGGHLAAPQSPEDRTFAQSLCPAKSDGCWIGPFTNQSCPLLTTKNRIKSIPENCETARPALCTAPLRRPHREYLIILATVSGLIMVAAAAAVLWLLRRGRRPRSRSRKPSSLSWKVFTVEELRSMTKNFSEGNRLMGESKTGCGGTFVGLLPDGSRVAIKRLSKSRLQRKKEFFSEVGRLARLRHPNLVALKGCCYDHGDRYLVHRFVSNGPLHRWLHHLPKAGKSLTWAVRINVATTLAQAIAFLHDKVKPQVVHRDIRASNVLLDEEFGAYLKGLGLGKFVYWEVMHERTKMAGSSGYLAPEFVYQNELTTKSDVFSFGVLLLEIVTGHQPAQAEDSVAGPSILHWATPLVQAHRHMDLLDPMIIDRPDPAAVHKVIDLVYACTQIVPSVRPRMSHVVHQLQLLCPSATGPLEAASSKSSLLMS